MRVELGIERLSKGGEGVASHQGRTVFVRGALPGERVAVEIKEDRKVLRGELLEVLTPSPARRAPACSLAEVCGGCDWLHVDEAAQRDAKVEIVLSALEHLGGIERTSLEVLETAVSPASLGYRRRAVLHASRRGLGFFGKSSHTHVAVDRCPALVPALQGLPGELSKRLGPHAGDVESAQLLSEGDQISVALLLKARVKPKLAEWALATCRDLSWAGVVLVPKEGAPQLIGRPVLRALSPLTPEVPLYLRPDAFAQANAALNVALVAAAAQELGATESDRVLELYAGNGNFTFALAGTAGSVLAVESSPVSVALAQRGAHEAGVANCRFVQGDVPKVVRGLISEQQRFDLLLADPPRTGASGIGRWARELGVRRVVYVACDPAALARDAAELKSSGLFPKRLRVLDMFPQTRHVEAVLTAERSSGARSA